MGLVHRARQHLGVADLGGHVGGVLDDLEGLAVEIQDWVVAGLDPDLLAALAEAAVTPGVVFTVTQSLPEVLVLGGRALDRVHEQAVVLPLDLG